jgi:hypothetical protein
MCIPYSRVYLMKWKIATRMNMLIEADKGWSFNMWMGRGQILHGA